MALVINQFATPGLGSLMAGRYIAGSIQLVLAIAGFCLIIAWFFMVLMAAYSIMETTGEPKPPHAIGWAGLICFASAWLYALVTSISILREAQRGQHRHFQQMIEPPVVGNTSAGPDGK